MVKGGGRTHRRPAVAIEESGVCERFSQAGMCEGLVRGT